MIQNMQVSHTGRLICMYGRTMTPRDLRFKASASIDLPVVTAKTASKPSVLAIAAEIGLSVVSCQFMITAVC